MNFIFIFISGVIFPEISDRGLIYGLMKEEVHQHQSKIITFQSTKRLGVVKLNKGLETAPWYVCEIFDEIKYFLWETLFEQIVDEHLPKKQIKVRSKDVPFMTQEWKEAIKKKKIC